MIPAAMSGGGTAPEAAPRTITVLRLKYAKAPDLAVTLTNVFNRESGQITTDERTNSLIFRVDEKTLVEMKKLIEQLDVQEVSPLSPQGGSAPQPLPGGM
jgi:type II secretory pathway component GspD/PulD (secretin)